MDIEKRGDVWCWMFFWCSMRLKLTILWCWFMRKPRFFPRQKKCTRHWIRWPKGYQLHCGACPLTMQVGFPHSHCLFSARSVACSFSSFNRKTSFQEVRRFAKQCGRSSRTQHRHRGCEESGRHLVLLPSNKSIKGIVCEKTDYRSSISFHRSKMFQMNLAQVWSPLWMKPSRSCKSQATLET